MLEITWCPRNYTQTTTQESFSHRMNNTVETVSPLSSRCENITIPSKQRFHAQNRPHRLLSSNILTVIFMIICSRNDDLTKSNAVEIDHGNWCYNYVHVLKRSDFYSAMIAHDVRARFKRRLSTFSPASLAPRRRTNVELKERTYIFLLSLLNRCCELPTKFWMKVEKWFAFVDVEDIPTQYRCSG